MRGIGTSFLVVMVVIAGCGAEPKASEENSQAPTTQPAWIATGDRDLDVTAIALLELIANDRVTYLDDGIRTQVVIHHMSNGPSFYISKEQVASEWNEFSPPSDAIDDLLARNRVAVKINWKMPESQFLITGLDKLPKDMLTRDDAFEKAYPNVAAHISLWLPGYSRDGKKAIVRFFFGPTPHGATASYVLELQPDGTWKIARRQLSFYA